MRGAGTVSLIPEENSVWLMISRFSSSLWAWVRFQRKEKGKYCIKKEKLIKWRHMRRSSDIETGG